MVVSQTPAHEPPEHVWSDPYALARYWADPCRQPLPGEATVTGALHEIAVMSTLADWLTRWLPIHLHQALASGVGVDAVAGAAGLPAREVLARWERWAAGQVDLWRTSNPHNRIGLHPDDYGRVHALIGIGGGR